MNLLLDTHILLWWYDSNPRLGNATRKVLDGSQARIWISAVSVWEISIKLSIGPPESKGHSRTAHCRLAATGLPIFGHHI
jgi:PIN domain nuclease of toxin-antitoxin system